jgi:hypothetical protein
LRIRTLCMAICTSVHWAFNLMLAKSTPYMIENLGGYGIYFVFAACVSRFTPIGSSSPAFPFSSLPESIFPGLNPATASDLHLLMKSDHCRSCVRILLHARDQRTKSGRDRCLVRRRVRSPQFGTGRRFGEASDGPSGAH